MLPKEENLKVKKTKLALQTALATLLEQKSFANITVNDICTQAMVSRSTFYLHFADKYMLLEYCLLQIKNSIFESRGDNTLQEQLLAVLIQIEKHVKVFRHLLRTNTDTELMDILRHSFQQDFEKLLTKNSAAPGKPMPMPELVCAFYAGGLSSVIMLWIQNKMPYSPNEVAECLYQLLPNVLTV